MIMKTWRTWWWAWSSILKVPRITSLQCLYNISKNKLWKEFSIFDESSQICPKYRKMSSLNFVLYCDAKHSDTLLNSSYVCRYFFSVAVVKNGCGLLDHGTLKFAVSQENELIKWTDLFICWNKVRKANVNLLIIGWAWPKMGSYKV